MCTPLKDPNFIEPCGFSDLPKKVIDAEEIPSLSVSEKPFTDIDFNHLDEFLDYFKFPTLTLVKGTVLCHSTSPRNFYNKYKGINVDIYNWWSEYFPGQSSYKGGWFTYETPYGGPKFSMNLYYRLEEDLTLLFIPNDFDEKYKRSDPRYFSEYHRVTNKITILNKIIDSISYGYDNFFVWAEKFINIIPESDEEVEIQKLLKDAMEQPNLKYSILQPLKSLKEFYDKIRSKSRLWGDDTLDVYSELYAGSHVIEGVEDWEKKGYEPLDHPMESYADNLSIKLANLGFNGYISCDECEVYITHEAMKRVLYQPFDFDSVQIRDPILREVIKKGFIPPFEPLNVTHLKNRDIELNESFVSLEDFI